MKNSNINLSKGKKENQLIFVEYEKPTKEGHLITVVDSYHNTIGRIHRSYNEQTNKYEFKAYDHSGKPLYMQSEKVWELKNQFTGNRSELLEDAHQRRIESKEHSKAGTKGNEKGERSAKAENTKSEKAQPSKAENEKRDESYLHDREEKNQVTREETEQAIREQELDSLREREGDREDRAMGR